MTQPAKPPANPVITIQESAEILVSSDAGAITVVAKDGNIILRRSRGTRTQNAPANAGPAPVAGDTFILSEAEFGQISGALSDTQVMGVRTRGKQKKA